MADSFDEFADNLQNQIFEDTKKEYGQVFFDRWKNIVYMGKLKDPDGYARITGTCGDTMEIFLQFKGDKVTASSFFTDGCGSSGVCGSFAVELAQGKDPDEIMAIDGEQILEILGGLPEDDRHCAFLAVETLHKALDDYMKNKAKKDRSNEGG